MQIKSEHNCCQSNSSSIWLNQIWYKKHFSFYLFLLDNFFVCLLLLKETQILYFMDNFYYSSYLVSK